MATTSGAHVPTFAEYSALEERVLRLEEGGSIPPEPPDPGPGPGPVKEVTVDANWTQIFNAIKDTTVDSILVRDGSVGGTSLSQSNAKRPSDKPVLVAAANKHKVLVTGWNREAINIDNGACYVNLKGFAFRNGNAGQGGCVVFGSSGSNGVDCHHMDIDDMDIDQSVTGPSPAGSTNNATAWGLYFGDAQGTGHHHIRARGWTVRAGHKGLAGGLQFYHSDPGSGNYNAHDIEVDGWLIDQTEQAIMVWDDTIKNIWIHDVTITKSGVYAVRQQYGAFTLERVVSTGSGSKGLQAASPSRVTLIDCSLA